MFEVIATTNALLLKRLTSGFLKKINLEFFFFQHPTLKT